MSGVDCVDVGAASVAGAASVVGAAAGAAASVAGACAVSSLMVFMVDTSCPRHRSCYIVAHTGEHTSYRKIL